MRPARLFLVSLTAGAALVTAAPLRAELTGAAERAGLPQFDMSYFPGQIFWLVVTFSVLYFLLSRIAIPAVARTQEKRHASIASELAAASSANEEAKKVIAGYEKTLADARIEAVEAVGDITRRAAQKSLEGQTEQQQKLSRHVLEVEARIAEARAVAMGDAQTIIAEITAAALEKVAGLKPQVRA